MGSEAVGGWGVMVVRGRAGGVLVRGTVVAWGWLVWGTSGKISWPELTGKSAEDVLLVYHLPRVPFTSFTIYLVYKFF